MILKYRHLEDSVLLRDTEIAAAREKEATLALLEYLLEIDRRRAYAIEAYSSLYDYLRRKLKHSETQASERVNAVRLLRSTPEIKPHLETGSLSLTSAAQIQRFIQTEKKVGSPVDPDRKSLILDQCIGQSKRTIEKILFQEASLPAQRAMSEKVRALDAERVEVKFSAGPDFQKKLEEIKNLIGNDTLESIFDRALETLLNKERKKRGRISSEGSQKAYLLEAEDEVPSTSPATQPKRPGNIQTSASTSRYIPVGFKRAIFLRSGGQCEFVDSESKRRCLSRYRLQIDHRIPLVLGGKTEPLNLRHFCTNHNLRAATEAGLTRKK